MSAPSLRMTAAQLRGAYVALVTPMTQVGREIVIDIPAYRRLLANCVEAGIAGVVVGGTTGQSSVLATDELLTLIHEACHFGRDYAAARGRTLQVIAGAGSNDTAKAVAMTRRLCEATEVDALLHVTGYYNNPPQEGLLRHFQAVADAALDCGRGIILYNVPSRTRSHLEVATVAELAAHPGVIGLKEACGDIEHVAHVIEATRGQDFSVVSGEDDQVAKIIALGGTGVISASANQWPREFTVLSELALDGRTREAAELQAALLPCIRAVFAAKNPIPLHHMADTRLRLPLVEVSELSEPVRSKVLATIASALAIEVFPHVTPLLLRAVEAEPESAPLLIAEPAAVTA